jgi:hypothetical protein
MKGRNEGGAKLLPCDRHDLACNNTAFNRPSQIERGDGKVECVGASSKIREEGREERRKKRVWRGCSREAGGDHSVALKLQRTGWREFVFVRLRRHDEGHEDKEG